MGKTILMKLRISHDSQMSSLFFLGKISQTSFLGSLIVESNSIAITWVTNGADRPWNLHFVLNKIKSFFSLDVEVLVLPLGRPNLASFYYQFHAWLKEGCIK